MNYNKIEVSAIKDYSHTAQLALCIEHIGAAMTALRVNNRVKSMPQFYQDYHNYSILCYAAHIGGTLEDRMADMVLGLVAFAKHNEIELEVKEYYSDGTNLSRLLSIATYIAYTNNLCDGREEFVPKTAIQVATFVNSALSKCVYLCQELNIDLSEHIRLKQGWLKTKDYE